MQELREIHWRPHVRGPVNANQVTGVLPIAHGGTGSSAKNFVDLSTDQTAGGNKTWTGTTALDGDVNFASGTTATFHGNASFDNLIHGNIDGNAGTVTNGLYSTGNYADPSWLTSLGGGKITGALNESTIPDLSDRYAKIDGSNATGTWGISISGNAATATNFTGSLSGDVTGSQSSTTVGKIQGVPVAKTTPASGNVLTYDGSEWAPQSPKSALSGLTETTVGAIWNGSCPPHSDCDSGNTLEAACPSGDLLAGGGYEHLIADPNDVVTDSYPVYTNGYWEWFVAANFTNPIDVSSTYDIAVYAVCIGAS